MNQRRPIYLLFALAVLAVSVSLVGSPVFGHNGEDKSEPVDGAVLDVAPTQVTFWFKEDVGQDSVSALLIDPTGSRIPLTVISSNQEQAIIALPSLANGVYSVRWKLISSDGHPVTDKITFTVAAQPPPSETAAPADTTVAADTTTPGTAPIATSTSPAAVPTTAAAVATSVPVTTAAPTTQPAVIPSADDVDPAAADDGDVFGTPDSVRWSLRFASYVAIFALIGVFATGMFVWPDAFARRRLIRASAAASAAIAGLALAQLAVLADDIDAGSMTKSWRKTLSFDVGVALTVRAAVALLVIVVLLRGNLARQAWRWVLAGLSLALLATWAFGGHAKSQRWSAVGLPIDVAHHGAAAVWVGCLAVAVLVTLRVPQLDQSRLVKRLSSTSFIAVVVMVVTGLVQAARLTGRQPGFLDAGHTRLVLAKGAVVIVMLAVANGSRRRTMRWSADADPSEAASIAQQIRRRMMAEVALGIGVVALTSSLVVAVPASSRDGGPIDPTSQSPASKETNP
jgi:copper transport protein